MNLRILQAKREALQMRYNLSHDHIECVILAAQIDLLDTLIEAMEVQ